MQDWDSLSSHQKLSLGVFIVVGVCAVILWPFLFHRQVTVPFLRTGDFAFKTSDQLEQERMAQLKTTDTDTDGLNDYDELYVFRTSPYLPDTDSDGVNDGAEVSGNMDPNCPKGKVCRQIGSALAAASKSVEGGTNAPTSGTAQQPAQPTRPTDDQVAAVILETFGDPTKLKPEQVTAVIAKMSGNDLRGFLGKLGIPVSSMQGAGDTQLRALVTDAMQAVLGQSQAQRQPAPAGGGAAQQ